MNPENDLPLQVLLLSLYCILWQKSKIKLFFLLIHILIVTVRRRENKGKNQRQARL